MRYHADATPLYELISTRLAAQKLSRGDLLRRMGYSNIAKAGRRFQALLEGDFAHPASQLMIQRLPAALQVENTFYQAIMAECLRRQRERLQQEANIAAAKRQREEAEARKHFVPHAMLVGTHRRPTQITAFALTGGAERWLKVPLNTTLPATTFAQQMVQHLTLHPDVPFFGPATGFVVRYDYDNSVRFDVKGNPVAKAGVETWGKAEIGVGGNTLTEAQLAQLLAAR